MKFVKVHALRNDTEMLVNMEHVISVERIASQGTRLNLIWPGHSVDVKEEFEQFQETCQLVLPQRPTCNKNSKIAEPSSKGSRKR